MIIESLALFLGASLLLVKSASYAVRSISSMGKSLRISDFFIAFAIAGLISVTPELFIGIDSAFAGTPEIGIGTLIGSNIADLTIVIGVIVLVGRKIKADKSILKNNLAFLILTGMPAVFMLDGYLSRDDGLILITIFLIYMGSALRQERIRGKGPINKKSVAKDILIFAVSMALLFAAAHLMVSSAVEIAGAVYLPPVVIALFLVSVGTTLPELTFSLRAVMAKHKEIAFGDILGNVAIDSTLSIGIVALISPVETGTAFTLSMFFMIFSALVISGMLGRQKMINWKEGLLLFGIYAVFAFIELTPGIMG